MVFAEIVGIAAEVFPREFSRIKIVHIVIGGVGPPVRVFLHSLHRALRDITTRSGGMFYKHKKSGGFAGPEVVQK
jgi:hypothetical protein